MAGPDHPGALALSADTPAIPEVDPLPPLSALPSDRPDYYDWPCRQEQRDGPGADEVLICDDPLAPDVVNATIIVAGGSHAGHWVPTLRILGEQHGWEILVADKSACQLSTPISGQRDSCQAWNAQFVPDNAILIDLVDQVCGPEVCAPVVGNIVVYRDGSHLSTLYAASLAPVLDDALREAVPSLYP